jgi:nucleotide-binding universal stress UspA family protein
MTLFKKILFPFDFSEPGKAAASSVAAVAARFDASVTVLNVFHFSPDYVVEPRYHESEASKPTAIPYTEEVVKLRGDQLHALENFGHAAFSGVRCKIRLEDGDPAQAIEWVAEHEKSDLIMMPTRGMGRFRRLLLGSVTAKVLHDTGCPVWTGIHAADGPRVASTEYRSIVCAVGMDPASEATLRMAARFARNWNARLCLLHIGSLHEGQSQEAAARLITHAFHQATSDTPQDALNIRARILEAPIPEGIRQVSVEENADLLIVGRGHLRGEVARAWSQVYEIIRESPCPVLSV